MADNIDVTPGTGKTISADEIAGVLVQRVKVQYGSDGSATDVDTGTPLPVTVIANTLATGAATSAKQDTGNTSLATIAGVVRAEDSAHTTGDTGVMTLAVRNDTGAVLAGSDGDYVPLTTDATGALRTDMNGTLSTNNSTAVVLAGGAAFTGTSEDVLNYNEIRISVIASHASATDGLSIQQSTDNSNWDVTDTYTIPAATGKTFSVPRQARYFRLVYTNGATLQTSFRLQTILNRASSRVSSQRPGDAYTNETDLEQQQSFLMGYNGTTWDRIRTKGTGVLSADTTTINNVTPLMGNGVTGTGSQRVTVASDNTPFPVKIDQTTPGTTNLVALAANQSVNQAQVNGVTVSTGNGVSGTGVQRVTLASDSTGQVALAAGAATIGALTANQSVNNAQINGVTPLMGNGVSGTGAQRVSLASDSTGNIATIGTSVTPGTAAANLGKAEDAVHASGDTGVMNLAVANEALSSISGTDGDYTPHGVDRKGRLFVTQKANTSTLASVASSATSVTLLASNSARIAATIYNDSTQVCYVKFGATASSTSFTVPLATNTYYEVPGGYTGIIDGIWVSANGNARVTELT